MSLRISSIYKIKASMQLDKVSTIKSEYFRQKGSWEEIVRKVCTWVNTSLNVIRIVGITSVLCHFDNAKLVHVFYNEANIPEDILKQTSHLVLASQIYIQQRTMMHSWRIHTQKMMPKLNQLSRRGEIVAINSLQHDQKHQYNLTIVWYKRSK